MSDPNGKLTDDERSRIIRWLTQYPNIEHRCPICGTTKWMVGENLVQPVTLGPGLGMQLGWGGYPLIVLISDPCGYTRFVNAVMIGIVEGAKSPDQNNTE